MIPNLTRLLFNHYYRSIVIIYRLRIDSLIILWFDLDFWNFICQLYYSYFYYAHDPKLPLKHQLWVPKWNCLRHILQIHVLQSDLTSNSHFCILLDQTGYVYCHIHIGDVTSTSTHSTNSNWSKSPTVHHVGSLVCPGQHIYQVSWKSNRSTSLLTHLHVVHSTHNMRNTQISYCIIQVRYEVDSKFDQTSFQSLL